MHFDLKIVSLFLSLWHSFLFIPSSKYHSPQVIITCKNEEQKRLFAKWHRYLFPNLRFKLTHVKTSDVIRSRFVFVFVVMNLFLFSYRSTFTICFESIRLSTCFLVKLAQKLSFPSFTIQSDLSSPSSWKGK